MEQQLAAGVQEALGEGADRAGPLPARKISAQAEAQVCPSSTTVAIEGRCVSRTRVAILRDLATLPPGLRRHRKNENELKPPPFTSGSANAFMRAASPSTIGPSSTRSHCTGSVGHQALVLPSSAMNALRAARAP